MTALPITSLIAAGLAILLLVLTFIVSKYRGVAHVPLGDGGDKEMLKRIRTFGNFTEYAPMGLILLALVEYSGGSSLIVWVIGGLLLGGRILHALGMLIKSISIGRMLGILATYLVFLISAIWLILNAIG